MTKAAFCVPTVLLLTLGASPLLAQTSKPQPPSSGPSSTQQEPCWQQAGIAKSVMQQRAAIGRETREQVEAACADQSLTPQQKRQKIREIRLQAKERIDALMTPQQLETLRACQQERAANRPPAPHPPHAGTGPCGETEPSAEQPEPKSPNSEQPPAEEETPPNH